MANFVGDMGFTPLHYACKHDKPEIARYLASFSSPVVNALLSIKCVFSNSWNLELI